MDNLIDVNKTSLDKLKVSQSKIIISINSSNNK